MNLSDEELHCVLRGLITEKKDGMLDIPEKFDNQDVRWRNILDYEVLWKSIKHHSHEIRRATIELLVVSKQSTRRFIRTEYRLIEAFLTYNLGEKIEFVPSIKKAIKRTRDSLIVLRRDLAKIKKIKSLRQANNRDKNCEGGDGYRDIESGASGIASKTELELSIRDCESFLIWLRKTCVENLYPTATHDRRRSCLQILRHMRDILDEEALALEWDDKLAESLFDCLLLDTYDSNKDTLYEILKPIPLRFLRLDREDRMAEIIETAIALGNSIRPIDSATAAHMFKISTWSPTIVEQVLRGYEGFEASDFAVVDSYDVHLALVNLLMLQLKKPLELAMENIVKAAGKHSLYGYIFCLRNLISDRDLRKCPNDAQWRKSIAKLVNICFDLNQAAGEIVNNSSPEGHLPMDLNQQSLPSSLFKNGIPTELEITTTPQMVLLCAWRTVKEVSLLFGYLTANLPIDDADGTPGLLAEQQVIKIGEHFVTLLSETKHRGAFEQAHVGFGQLCGRLWRQPDGSRLKELPKIWLLELLLAVTGLSPRDGKLCATRRSAGVPFMVQALLTSEESSSAVIKHGGSFSFHSTMRILLGLTNLEDDDDAEARMISLIYNDTVFAPFEGRSRASSDDVEPRSNRNAKASLQGNCRLAEVKTHVLNILRALFRHCQLGECVKPYIADGVMSAIKSYNGKTWAERNAATLLFSAMMIRIFGVQRTKDHLNLSVHNKMTGKVFFERYPTLLGFMHTELEEFVKPGDTLIRPGVQSVLLLLSRLYPGCHDSEDSNWRVAKFIEMVSKCAKSPVCETRELAARALVPLLTETTSRVVFSNILETISAEFRNYSNVNTIHGYILQILQISRSAEFAAFEPSSAQMKNFVVNSFWILEKLEKRSRGAGTSFPLATTYLETLLEIHKANSEWLRGCLRTELIPRIKLHLEQSGVLSEGPGREVYEIAAAKFFTYCEASEGKTSSTWTPLLRHNNLDVRVVAWIKSAELVTGRNVDLLFRQSQLRNAVFEAEKAIKESTIDDPYLEQAVFEFLYVIFEDNDRGNPLKTDPSAFSNLLEQLATYLSKKLSDKKYYVKAGFLRVLGAFYGAALKHSKTIMSSEDKTAVYELFFKNSWMDSCDNDCRLAVSQTIHHLYEPTAKANERFVMLWWTILLNLLLDDDRIVRQRAAAVVCGIGTRSEPVCDVRIRREFFEKFSTLVGKERPDVAMATLYSWGVATWREETYEMDDTDVFNRGRNYDSYEQLEIANTCAVQLQELRKDNPANMKLEPTIIAWLRDLYDCGSTFSNLTEFVEIQAKSIPVLGKKLSDYLDPTYEDKLQQVLAYERMRDEWNGAITPQPR